MSAQPPHPSTSVRRERTSSEREQRYWWVVDRDSWTVLTSLGYSCAPENPTAWWFPSLGWTMWEGSHLFPTRRQANAQMRKEIQRQQERLQKTLRSLIDEGPE